MTTPARPARDRLAAVLALEFDLGLNVAGVRKVADALLAPDGAVTELIAEAVAEARERALWDGATWERNRANAAAFRAAAAPEEGREDPSDGECPQGGDHESQFTDALGIPGEPQWRCLRCCQVIA